MISVEMANELTTVRTQPSPNKKQKEPTQVETIVTKLHKIGLLKKAVPGILAVVLLKMATNTNLPGDTKLIELAQQFLGKLTSSKRLTPLKKKIAAIEPEDKMKYLLFIGKTLVLLYMLHMLINKYGMQFVWGQLLKADLKYTSDKGEDSDSDVEKPSAYIVSKNRSGIIIRGHHFAVEHKSATEWTIYQQRRRESHGMQIVPILTNQDVQCSTADIETQGAMASTIKFDIAYNDDIGEKLMQAYNTNSRRRVLITQEELKSMIVLAPLLAYHAHYQRPWYLRMCLNAIHVVPYVALVCMQIIMLPSFQEKMKKFLPASMTKSEKA